MSHLAAWRLSGRGGGTSVASYERTAWDVSGQAPNPMLRVEKRLVRWHRGGNTKMSRDVKGQRACAHRLSHPRKGERKRFHEIYSRLLITSPGNGLKRETNYVTVNFCSTRVYTYIQFIELIFNSRHLRVRMSNVIQLRFNLTLFKSMNRQTYE